MLITGATGFIGRATVTALRESGWQTILGGRAGGISLTQGAVHLDLEDPATILALENGPRCAAIVHLGARVGLSGDSESEMFAPNILATGCLAYLASQWDAHLIYASTIAVYGAKAETIKLDSQICPETAYAKSKWLGEQLVKASNIKHCVLRIAGVFGCTGPAHLGLNRAIDGAIKGELPLQMGTGAALRNYVYVKDVAQAIVYALQENLDGEHLLAGIETHSVADLLQQICDTFMPDTHPIIKDGSEASNQVVIPSGLLPNTRSFREALVDIKKGCRQ